jgi:phage/plasmid-like protein (TIGR03299 family)
MPAEVENMFSVKERPWHGLGTVLENAPSIEEGIRLAGLDWDVTLRSIASNDDEKVEIDTHKIVVREDNKKPLGVVSSKYKAVQNKEAFSFFEPFIESGMASLETAGSLFDGKRVFVLAKINSEDMEVSKDDIIEKYILLSNSHDGSQALRIGYTPIRVVCNNTLSAAISSKDSALIRLTHRGEIVSNLTEIRETMDLVNQQFITTEEKYKYLATRDINQNDLKKYVKQVFSAKSLNQIISDYDKGLEEKEEIEKWRQRLMDRVEEIFELEPVHNAWTMYNSVNYFLNHKNSKTLEHRYNSMWFGDRKRLDNKAFELALQY